MSVMLWAKLRELDQLSSFTMLISELTGKTAFFVLFSQPDPQGASGHNSFKKLIILTAHQNNEGVSVI